MLHGLRSPYLGVPSRCRRAFLEAAGLSDSQHSGRGPERLDARGLQNLAPALAAPIARPNTCWPPYGGRAVDGGEVPAVVPLHWAEETPERRPGTPPDFAPRPMCRLR